jgi:hypothetical protein
VFPIRKVTGVMTHPARTAGAVAGATLGVSVGAATAGMRATARAVGWALERAGVPAPEPAPAPWPRERDGEPDPEAETIPVAKAPVKKAPVKKAAARKAPVKKAAARKAPSKKAAVIAPALGLPEAVVEHETDLDQPRTEPLMDPATAKAVASESEVMRRAADPDKG